VSSLPPISPEGNGPVRQKSWLAGKAVWMVPIVLLLVVSPCGLCVWFGFGAWGLLGVMTKPLDEAVVALENDSRVVEKLGTPLTRGSSFKLSNYNNNNGNGGAEMEFNVNGPMGSASVSGKMALTADVWRPDGLNVKFSDGTSISLP
jgi:Cytochrome oxidase complex assembly protein 1